MNVHVCFHFEEKVYEIDFNVYISFFTNVVPTNRCAGVLACCYPSKTRAFFFFYFSFFVVSSKGTKFTLRVHQMHTHLRCFSVFFFEKKVEVNHRNKKKLVFFFLFSCVNEKPWPKPSSRKVVAMQCCPECFCKCPLFL